MAWAKAQPDVFIVNIHGNPYQMRGIPDVTGCVGQISFFCELKSGTNKMSYAQQAVAHKILKSGGNFVCVNNFKDFVDFINELRLKNKNLTA